MIKSKMPPRALPDCIFSELNYREWKSGRGASQQEVSRSLFGNPALPLPDIGKRFIKINATSKNLKNLIRKMNMILMESKWKPETARKVAAMLETALKTGGKRSRKCVSCFLCRTLKVSCKDFDHGSCCGSCKKHNLQHLCKTRETLFDAELNEIAELLGLIAMRVRKKDDGTCRRKANCRRYFRHPGFCSGQKK
uniref:Zn(2)-C6 fungal-type domain-containing protein n=1 Tax=Lotharella oceanica TaxID=641309 RepID=A0A7S2XAW9_9EUKA|mmetsp:Transcript_19352/g.36426  ORF Transcript_19352/g.36426 Transcript_19352/m.36426 type:complete len:195 (+) Transcript_19352:62-646(+)